MVRGSVAPVLCTTRLVGGVEQKPTTCALRRSGVKYLPCKRMDALTPVPLASSGSMVRGSVAPVI